jgi:hypothetical protein
LIVLSPDFTATLRLGGRSRAVDPVPPSRFIAPAPKSPIFTTFSASAS